MSERPDYTVVHAYSVGNPKKNERGTAFVASLDEVMQRKDGQPDWYIYEFLLCVPNDLLDQFNAYGLWPSELGKTSLAPVMTRYYDCEEKSWRNL